ncbi:lactonase family protein [Ramlibacter humi]|uniref:YncE family protein n=1 Tax=Ramlibacter humi TaxID=2530451 RepID=A0A4Z0BN51_9BURK|nr:beta-propeller fold lactonase family protein [Ramlibacter humi]TFZ00261.1 hypothetical protein EZ216_14270 [Ramlibacter humi]
MSAPILLRPFRAFLASLAILAFAGCGGGESGSGGESGQPSPAADADFTVSAEVAGLRGSGLVLALDGAEDVAVGTNGRIAFARKLKAGQPLSLTVKTQPSMPAQRCGVELPGQAVMADTVVQVRCSYGSSAFVYVGNFGAGIEVLKVEAGAVSKIQSLPFDGPDSVAVSPDQSLVVAKGAGNNSLVDFAAFRVDAASGTLTATPATPAKVSSNVSNLVFHPNGRFVYVPDPVNGTITRFQLDPATGALTTAGAALTGLGNVKLALRPDGKFAYAINVGASGVQVFSVHPDTGGLTPLRRFDTANLAFALAVDPLGKYLYVGQDTSTDAWVMDPQTGLVSIAATIAKPGALVAAHPSGDFLFVYGLLGKIASYHVDRQTGQMELAGEVPCGPGLSALVGLGDLILSSNGDQTASVFLVDPASGVPSLIGDTAFGAGISDVKGVLR